MFLQKCCLKLANRRTLKGCHLKNNKVLIIYVVIYTFCSSLMTNLLFNLYWCTNLATGTACAVVYLMIQAYELCILKALAMFQKALNTMSSVWYPLGCHALFS